MLMVLVFSLLSSLSVQADEHGTDARKFLGELKAFNSEKQIYTIEQSELATEPLIKKLSEIAWEQAQVWADTILEGDYTSDGKTRLDEVFELYRNGQLVGYRISYSEGAWDISECAYDGDEETLKTCEMGRIVESSFVSPTFKTFVRDENQFAEFLAN